MKRALLFLFLFFCAGLTARAQGNFTTVTAAHIQDATGAPLSNASICFQGTDNNGNVISYQAGGGGAIIRTPVCTAVNAGAISGFQVANPANTSPSNIRYHITVMSGTRVVVDAPMAYLCAQSGACTSPYSFNFDNCFSTGACVANPVPITRGPIGPAGPPGPAGMGGAGSIGTGSTPNLAAYTGSTAVGDSGIPSTSVAQKTTANTWTLKQTFSADPLFGSAAPWTDVRSNGSVCNGSTDSSTGIGLTFTSLATYGGTAFLPDNCNYTPPSSLPVAGSISGYFAPIISLGGQLNLTSTLHLNNYFQLECQSPAMRNPAAFGAPIAMEKFCPILSTTAFGFTPLISEESNAFVLKDLYLNLFCGSGIKIFPTGDGDVGIVENVFSQGGNCAGNSSGIEQDYGFGVWYRGGGFQSSRLGTSPSMWFHSLAALDPPGSITTFDHTFLASHGIRYDTTGSLCAGNGITTSIRSVQQLYENSNQEGHVPPDPNSALFTWDVANCTYSNILIDSPVMDDTTGFVPLLSIINSAGSGTQGVRGLFLLNPTGDFSGPLVNVVPPAASAIDSVIFSSDSRTLGLYGSNCSYFAYISGNQVNCNAATNVPVADIAGHAIGMASPASMACSASTMGGSLATGTYYVIAAAEGTNVAGATAESVLSNEYVVPVTGPTGSITCANGGTIFPNGATGIRFYYGTAGSLQESVYERNVAGIGTYSTFTIIGSGAVSATPAQLQPNPSTMAVTDSFGGQYETVATSDTPVYGPLACFGIGMRCTSLGTYRTQINGSAQISGNISIGSTIPASSSAACVTGTVTWGSGFIYVCVATNTWQRAAMATW